MKRIAMLTALLLAIGAASFAQVQPVKPVNPSDAATNEDINRFFDTMHLRTQMPKVIEAMMVQMKANANQMLRKNMPEATPEDIARAEQLMDEALERTPAVE